VLRLLVKDLESQSNNNGKKEMLLIALLNHSFHLLFLIRLGGFLNDNIPIVGGVFRFFIEYFIRIVFSSDISCKARLGGGVNIMHGHDIVIGSGVRIGNNCKIFNGVTLGNKDVSQFEVAQPIVGDGVVIGTGAKILGNVRIGDNSIIGANSVVLSDVPSNSVCVGVPAKVVKSRMREVGK
jgi:serine O-acetyltransferase